MLGFDLKGRCLDRCLPGESDLGVNVSWVSDIAGIKVQY